MKPGPPGSISAPSVVGECLIRARRDWCDFGVHYGAKVEDHSCQWLHSCARGRLCKLSSQRLDRVPHVLVRSCPSDVQQSNDLLCWSKQGLRHYGTLIQVAVKELDVSYHKIYGKIKWFLDYGSLYKSNSFTASQSLLLSRICCKVRAGERMQPRVLT